MRENMRALFRLTLFISKFELLSVLSAATAASGEATASATASSAESTAKSAETASAASAAASEASAAAPEAATASRRPVIVITPAAAA